MLSRYAVSSANDSLRRASWAKADAQGRLDATGGEPASSEQVELALLRAELARVKME
jgi:hypothetical protein